MKTWAYCPICNEGVQEPARNEPYAVPCPECGTAITVPSASEVERRTVGAVEPHAESVGEYQIAAPQPASGDSNRSHPVAGAASDPSQTDPSQTGPTQTGPGNGNTGHSGGVVHGSPHRKLSGMVYTVTCGTCHERVEAVLKKTATVIDCPECGRKLKIPALDDYERTVAPAVSTKRVSAFKISPTLVSPQRAQSVFTDPTTVQTRNEPEPPPRSLFFSDVFDYPWKRGVIGQWFRMSLGLSLSGSIFAAVWLLAFASNPYLVALFFGGAVLMSSIFAMSYSSAVLLDIVIDTSAGNSRPVEAPDADYKEWVGRFAYLVWFAVGAMAVAGTLTSPLERPEVRLACMLPIWVATFPLALLSSLHVNSLVMPISLDLIMVFPRIWRQWLAFYVLSLILAAGYFGAFTAAWMLDDVNIFLGWMVVQGPITAAVGIIAARLLGRLAYHVSSVIE